MQVVKNKHKVINRWYYTPQRVRVMFPGVSDVCWRCGGKLGRYIHIWWNCSLLRVFWKQIHNFVTLLGIKVPFSPRCYISEDLCTPKVNRTLFF